MKAYHLVLKTLRQGLESERIGKIQSLGLVNAAHSLVGPGPATLKTFSKNFDPTSEGQQRRQLASGQR